MEKITIKMPWPPKELSPNSRVHWAVLAKHKARFKQECYITAKAHGVNAMATDRLHVTMTFYPPTNRAYDLDNALARCKAMLDGLSQAVGVDDSKWEITIRKGEGKGGFVMVEIT